MAKWIPGLAVLGLLCVMILPAPGIWGIVIGGGCLVVIFVGLIMLALDRMATGILSRVQRRKRKQAGRARVYRTVSGIARKL